MGKSAKGKRQERLLEAWKKFGEEQPKYESLHSTGGDRILLLTMNIEDALIDT